MDQELLKKLVRESANLIEEVLGPSEPLLVKALLIAKVFDLMARKELESVFVSIKEGMKDKVTERPINTSMKLEINELINLVKPKSNSELLAIFGYYLRNHGMDRFGNDELKDLFKKSKRKIPVNLSDAVSKTIIKGYFVELEKPMESGQRAISLTSTGIKFVEDRLGDTNGK
ncbi:MAG: hypothetical protein AB1556_13345 [Bacillota bacterium]